VGECADSFGGQLEEQLVITTIAPRSFSACLFVLLAFTVASVRASSEMFASQMYDVTTETGMPHLEENLRYTITHEKRCLKEPDLAVAFPILTHPALKGCSLQDERRKDDTVSYTLMCTGGHGTTGEAIWHIGERQIRGTLNVKLGGKNMTFYQRVTALHLGACTP
jgi:hypothetical protein